MERTSGAFVDETVGAARRKVEEIVSGVKEQASKIKSRSLEDLWNGTTDYIKDNPGKTILVSVAFGVVLGSLLRRKGD